MSKLCRLSADAPPSKTSNLHVFAGLRPVIETTTQRGCIHDRAIHDRRGRRAKLGRCGSRDVLLRGVRQRRSRPVAYQKSSHSTFSALDAERGVSGHLAIAPCGACRGSGAQAERRRPFEERALPSRLAGSGAGALGFQACTLPHHQGIGENIRAARTAHRKAGGIPGSRPRRTGRRRSAEMHPDRLGLGDGGQVSRHLSRPMPDCLKPPQIEVMSPWSKQLTQTTPASISRAALWATETSEVQIDAARP